MIDTQSVGRFGFFNQLTNNIIITIIIIIIDNFCIALFSGVHKLTALYNIFKIFQVRKK